MRFNWTDKVPTLSLLKAFVRQHCGMKDIENIEVAKFITHAFEWRHIDGAE